MISKTVNRKITSGDVILYRRVSTKDQEDDGYRHQLEVIKSKYPTFSITHSTVYDYKEVMSGLEDMGKRSASKLGPAIYKLKRHLHSIILVSDADRISRRADVFELIQKQGLGHRIYAASSGLIPSTAVQIIMFHEVWVGLVRRPIVYLNVTDGVLNRFPFRRSDRIQLGVLLTAQ